MLSLKDGPDGAVSADGLVSGCYLHGLFAADEFRHRFLFRLRSRESSGLNYETSLGATLDALAAHLDRHLDLDRLKAIADRQIEAAIGDQKHVGALRWRD